jgi:hypothetical protein
MMLIRFIVAAVLLWPAVAKAEITWRFSDTAGRAYLQGYSDEIEGDNEFWARCRPDGSIDIGVGADSGVGSGIGDTVTLTLSSDEVSAQLTGPSRKSLNFQMTGGTELRARISRDDAVFHAVFQVFVTGKPIRVAGIGRSVTWQTKGLKANAEAFLASCK